MAKVFGAIFLILGGFILLYISFVFLNTSAYLDYNAEKLRFSDTGLVLPSLGGAFLFITGFVFYKASDDK